MCGIYEVETLVNKEGKRKFVYQDRLYYWRVNQDCWFCPATLIIFSEDKKFRLEYAVDYSTDKFPITPAFIRNVLEKQFA